MPQLLQHMARLHTERPHTEVVMRHSHNRRPIIYQVATLSPSMKLVKMC
jgi:hypothetical protein